MQRVRTPTEHRKSQELAQTCAQGKSKSKEKRKEIKKYGTSNEGENS